MYVAVSGADGAGLGCPNVQWQIYECGPSDSYHVPIWWVRGLKGIQKNRVSIHSCQQREMSGQLHS